MAGERSEHTAAARSQSGGLWGELEWSLRNLAGMVSLCSSSPSLDCSFSTFALQLFSLNPLSHLQGPGWGAWCEHCAGIPAAHGRAGLAQGSSTVPIPRCPALGFPCWGAAAPISHPMCPSGKPCNRLLLCEKQLNHSSWVTCAPISYYFNAFFSQA